MAEGINDAGLGASLLWDASLRNYTLPQDAPANISSISYVDLVQYVLSQFSTVAEVRAALDPSKLSIVDAPQYVYDAGLSAFPIHVHITDSSKDDVVGPCSCAVTMCCHPLHNQHMWVYTLCCTHVVSSPQVIEFEQPTGRVLVQDNPLLVLTNEPQLTQQLELLSNWVNSTMSQRVETPAPYNSTVLPLPGDSSSTSECCTAAPRWLLAAPYTPHFAFQPYHSTEAAASRCELIAEFDLCVQAASNASHCSTTPLGTARGLLTTVLGPPLA